MLKYANHILLLNSDSIWWLNFFFAKITLVFLLSQSIKYWTPIICWHIWACKFAYWISMNIRNTTWEQIHYEILFKLYYFHRRQWSNIIKRNECLSTITLFNHLRRFLHLEGLKKVNFPKLVFWGIFGIYRYINLYTYYNIF